MSLGGFLDLLDSIDCDAPDPVPVPDKKPQTPITVQTAVPLKAVPPVTAPLPKAEPMPIKTEPPVTAPHLKADTLPVSDPKVIPDPPGYLIATGILTEVNPIPTIDDEHLVRKASQTLPLGYLVKGHKVRYAYKEKGGMRKEILILECLTRDQETISEAAEPPKEPKVQNSTPSAGLADIPLPPVKDLSIADAVSHEEEPVDKKPGILEWEGQVKVMRKSGDSTILEIHFANGLKKLIVLTPDIYSAEIPPLPEDTITAEIKYDGDDDEEDIDNEDVQVLKIAPKSVSLMVTGKITAKSEEFGVIDEDVYFTEDTDLEVGSEVQYTAVSCRKNDFRWRCISLAKSEANNEREVEIKAFVDNKDNFTDRNGISVVNRDQLKIRMYAAGQTAEMKLVFSNTGPKTTKLLNLWLYSEKGRPFLRLKSDLNQCVLSPNSEIHVVLAAYGRQICNHTEYAIAYFKNDLVMVAEVTIAVGSDEIVASVAAREHAYRAMRKPGIMPVGPTPETMQYSRVTRPSRKFVEVRIKSFPVPQEILEWMNLSEAEFEQKCLEEISYIEEPLCDLNYKTIQHQMTYISEAYLKKCFRVYEMTQVRFTKVQNEENIFRLELENLAESRPSVLEGDGVIAIGGNVKYKGFITRILHDHVRMEFTEGFNQDHLEKLFDVAFLYSRSPFQKLHHALDVLVEKFGDEFLFPKEVHEKRPLLDVHFDCAEDATEAEILQVPMTLKQESGGTKVIPWLNPTLNWHQKKSIANALRGECRPLPHLICGPPGTGKTSTLVELVLQQFLNSNQSHILVCTPSNSAADLILKKLVESGQLLRDHFIRVVGVQAKEREIEEQLKQFCGTVEKSKEGTEGREICILENGFRENCQMEYLCDFRIILVTIGSVGTFMEMGFPEGHFTHLYVDEAAQCLESEIIIPMTLLNKTTGHFVFVGDEKQLGPVVPFHPLVKWNYGISLFERLQAFPIYNREDAEAFDQRLCYQLVCNYRSVPSVLKVYNLMFYDNTLKPMITNEEREEFECLSKVAKLFPTNSFRAKHAGVFFFTVKGGCTRSALNPSWFNLSECTEVAKFYEKLFAEGLTEADVGIISPYQEQVRVIRSHIQATGIPCPKVGSVEEFQGQERKVIILSTVRSKRRREDTQFGLGFVNHPKRINVAISRAQSALVVFGNGIVLGEDPNWKKLIRHCMTQYCTHEIVVAKKPRS